MLPNYCLLVSKNIQNLAFEEEAPQEIAREFALYNTDDTNTLKSTLVSVLIVLLDYCDGVDSKMTDFLFLVEHSLKN